MGVISFIKGRGLVKGENVGRNWVLIIMIIILFLVVIWSGHLTDEKIVKISKLQIEKKRVKSEYVVMKVKLAKLKLESSIREEVKGYLVVGDHPKKIKVIVKKQ